MSLERVLTSSYAPADSPVSQTCPTSKILTQQITPEAVHVVVSGGAELPEQSPMSKYCTTYSSSSTYLADAV